MQHFGMGNFRIPESISKGIYTRVIQHIWTMFVQVNEIIHLVVNWCIWYLVKKIRLNYCWFVDGIDKESGVLVSLVSVRMITKYGLHNVGQCLNDAGKLIVCNDIDS